MSRKKISFHDFLYGDLKGESEALTAYNTFCAEHEHDPQDVGKDCLEYSERIFKSLESEQTMPVDSKEFWQTLGKQYSGYKKSIRDETEDIQAEIDRIEDAIDLENAKLDALNEKASMYRQEADNRFLSQSTRNAYHKKYLYTDVEGGPIHHAIAGLKDRLADLNRRMEERLEEIRSSYPLVKAMGELADMIPSVDIPKDNSTASFEEIPGEDTLCVAGPSAVGKTTMGLQITTKICARNTGRNRILYLAADDSRRIIEPKFEHALARFAPEDRARIRRNLALVPISMQYDILDDDGVKKFHRLIRKILHLRGFRKNEMALIVLDTLRRFHGASENCDDNAKKLIDAMQGIVDDTGASVLFIHHTTKTSRQNGADDATSIRGSSVLVDNIKNVILLVPMTGRETEELVEIRDGVQIPISDRRLFVRKIHVKRNDCGILPDVWLKRDTDGTLMPVDVREKGGAVPAGTEAAPVESGGKGKPGESGKVPYNQSFV